MKGNVICIKIKIRINEEQYSSTSILQKKKCCIPTLQIDIFIEKIHGCKIQDMSMSFSNFFNHDWPNSTYISYITLPLFENPINRLQSSFLSHGGIVEMNQNDLNSPKHEK